MRNIINLLLFLSLTTAFGQTINLKGKVTDDQNFPLESATIYLTSVKDSTIVDYTISDKNGNWQLKIRKLDKAVFLKISYIGLADYKQQVDNLNEDRDFGTIKLADKSTELNEVLIENEIPPIRIKKDTLEFNAASFKVRPDANVETLLKQLPGVEIGDDTKIKVNGKEVNQILVNGKPFFDKDGKIALENLPAEIINKVQVTDTKTKTEELTGDKASGNNASINLTIDEEKNKGFFGRFVGGYGSNKRYESNALINYFKGNRKISLLASSNNINTTGFSMDEIFDSMNGGRNNSFYTSSDGSFGVNGMQFGGSRGITRTNIFGLTYADQWFKGFDPNINYFYTSADTDNNNKTRSQVFLPDNPNDPNADKMQTSESSSRTDTFKYAHNLNSEFEFKVDSTSTIFFSPKFSKANTKTTSTSQRTTRNQDNRLLNESSGSNHSDTDNNAFTTNLNYTKSLNKKGRSLSFEFNSENKLEDAEEYTQSDTYFYEDANNDGIYETRADIRNQLRKNRESRDFYRGNLQFNEAITDSLRLRVGATYNNTTNVENRKGYKFSEVTGGFTDIYNELTNYLRSNETRITPYTNISINKKKFYFGVGLGTSIIDFKNFGSYMGNNYTVNKNYLLPWANGYLNFKLTKSQSLYLNYSYEVTMPRAAEILPIADLSSPLYTTIGNENLNPNKAHSFYMSLYNYDYASHTGYSFYAGGSYDESSVAGFTDLDTGGKQTTTYGNISGTFDSWFGASWSKQIKNEDSAHKYRLNLSFNGGYALNKGVTNKQMYEARSYRIGPKVGLSYDYGELLNISPIYSFEYNETHYTNYSSDFSSNFIHKVGVQTTHYWPKHVVFGNDFTYTYNSNLGAGYKKDFFLWNTSLGYNFLNDKLMFKVKVYDLLNQNLSTMRYISPTSITDTQNTVLKRYVMFSLTYKIKKFGGKETKSRGNRFWMF